MHLHQQLWHKGKCGHSGNNPCKSQSKRKSWRVGISEIKLLLFSFEHIFGLAFRVAFIKEYMTNIMQEAVRKLALILQYAEDYY